MYGMPPGFEALLRRKYDILAQNADADTLRARASAGLDNVRARLLPQESNANVAQTLANTDQTKAQTTGINIKNKYLPNILDGEINLNRANIGLIGAQTRSTDATTQGISQINSLYDIESPYDKMLRERGLTRGQGFGFGGAHY